MSEQIQISPEVMTAENDISPLVDQEYQESDYKTTIQFESGITLDFIKIDKNTDGYEAALPKKNAMQVSTVLFNNFTEMIEATYNAPDGSQDTNAGFTVYRRIPGQNYLQFVCDLTDGEYIVYDYNIRNNEFYHYIASTQLVMANGEIRYDTYENKIKNDVTGSLEDEYLQTKWNDFSICNIEETTTENIYMKTGDVWEFKYNVSSEDITINTSISAIDSLGRYGKVATGTKKYDSGTVSVLLGSITDYKRFDSTKERDLVGREVYGYTEKIDYASPYSQETEKLHRWKDFATDGKLKLLKDWRGNAWVVQIRDMPTYGINLNSNLSQTTISFAWQEVLDMDKISIIGFQVKR